jgi:hypothetical protein
MALSIKVGDIIPEGSFPYIPYTAGLEDKVSSTLGQLV